MLFMGQDASVTDSLMNPKLLPVCLLFVCQFQLFAQATANETVILWSTVYPVASMLSRTPKRCQHQTTAIERPQKRRYSTGLTTTFCRTAVIEREIGLKPDGFIKIIAATFLSGLLV